MEKTMGGFEASMEELENILQKMGDSSVGLEESLELYARAAELLKDCSAGLDKAQLRIREIDAEINEIGPESDDEL